MSCACECVGVLFLFRVVVVVLFCVSCCFFNCFCFVFCLFVFFLGGGGGIVLKPKRERRGYLPVSKAQSGEKVSLIRIFNFKLLFIPALCKNETMFTLVWNWSIKSQQRKKNNPRFSCKLNMNMRFLVIRRKSYWRTLHHPVCHFYSRLTWPVCKSSLTIASDSIYSVRTFMLCC